MSKEILIDAVGINRGGGKILLDYFIRNVELESLDIVYLLDRRILNNHPGIEKNKVIYINHNFFERFIFYIRNKKEFVKILCLANFPPPVKCNSKVYTFFQNVAIFDKVIYSGIKSILIRLMLMKHKKYTDHWIVQTNSVRDLLVYKFNPQDKIFVYPFYFFEKNFIAVEEKIKKSKKILYVSDGDPHKNHKKLLRTYGN